MRLLHLEATARQTTHSDTVLTPDNGRVRCQNASRAKVTPRLASPSLPPISTRRTNRAANAVLRSKGSRSFAAGKSHSRLVQFHWLRDRCPNRCSRAGRTYPTRNSQATPDRRLGRRLPRICCCDTCQQLVTFRAPAGVRPYSVVLRQQSPVFDKQSLGQIDLSRVNLSPKTAPFSRSYGAIFAEF